MYGDTNAMIKKEVFLKLGGFPEDFGYAFNSNPNPNPNPNPNTNPNPNPDPNPNPGTRWRTGSSSPRWC